MYLIFESGEFKTILTREAEVVELLENCGYREEPYEIYKLGDLRHIQYTEFVPNFYENF